MRRTFAAVVVAVVSGLIAPSAVRADDPPPTPTAPSAADLEAAKKAFQEGNAAYKAGKFADAVDKLRESYRLSKNAILLYNIGYIQEQAGHEDEALFYYKKFLTDAPATAPMHSEAVSRVDALEKEGVKASADPDAPPPVVNTNTPPPPPPKPKPTIEHALFDEVPPGLPIDITAKVPDEPGLALTLSYRVSGEATFTKLDMFKRKDQLVARIPAARVQGKIVQYFLELKASSGTLITRMGRGTAPNLINVEATAPPHYDKTMADDGTDAPIVEERKPLPPPIPVVRPEDKPDPNRFGLIKWISTGTAGALLGTSIVSYVIAGNQHDHLVDDTKSCGTPPCREFDLAHAKKLEDLGRRYDAIYKVTLAVGIGVAGVAGYFWYRDLKAHREGEQGVAVVPTAGNGFAGLTAVGSF